MDILIKLYLSLGRFRGQQMYNSFLFSPQNQGPVVQSVVSLTSSRVISLTVLADSIYNILIFFAAKM